MAEYDYDLAVLGSGAAGLHAAIRAAKLGARVALIEREQLLGGVTINSGTIPSKALREAALYLCGTRRRLLNEEGYVRGPNLSVAQVMARCEEVQQHEHEIIVAQLDRWQVQVLQGTGSFITAHRLEITGAEHDGRREISASKAIIAVGTRPHHPAGIPFDGRQVLDSDEILQIESIPRSLAVVGAGVIGCEYASIFAALGVTVTLIDRHPTILDFVDSELVDALVTHLRMDLGVNFVLGQPVAEAQVETNATQICLADGGQVIAEKSLYCAGRCAWTDTLNLEAIGLKPADDQGHLHVDENYQTAVAGVYAAGDVTGFPGLAATAMEQGRVAACHALGVHTNTVPAHFPFGIYTIPELSMVGSTERELIARNIPHGSGRAHYRDIARAQILGDTNGFIKILFHTQTHAILGVHVIGEGATELVHLGQAVMSLAGGLEYLRDAVFNYPTLAEGYKIAALDGFDRLEHR